ncbi:macro domain-containing protein [bacterium]|nr:macro domain-containing protein [bacterium]
MLSINDRIQILKGDITNEKVDAIVNAANTDLILGAGVAGAIRCKGGASIQQECDLHGTVELGGAALTGGGDLPAKHVIHAAAMHLGSQPTADSIANATLNSLSLASSKQFNTISFPALGTGIGGFSMEKSADVMMAVVKDFMRNNDFPVIVRFVLFDETGFNVFQNKLIDED